MTIDLGFAWMTLPGRRNGGHRGRARSPRFYREYAGRGGRHRRRPVRGRRRRRGHAADARAPGHPGHPPDPGRGDRADQDRPGPRRGLAGAGRKRTCARRCRAPCWRMRPSCRSRRAPAQGLPELVRALEACLAERPARPDLGRAAPAGGPGLHHRRFWHGGDRHADGRRCFKLGEEVELLPSGLRGRIRGLQTHKKKEQSAVPGSRTAVNISGLDVDQVRRGEVLAHPGKYRATQPAGRAFPAAAGRFRAAAPLRRGEILHRQRRGAGARAPAGRRRAASPARRAGCSSSCASRWWRCAATATSCAAHPLPRRWAAARSIDPHPTRRHRRFRRSRYRGAGVAAAAVLRPRCWRPPSRRWASPRIKDAAARSRLGPEQAAAGAAASCWQSGAAGAARSRRALTRRPTCWPALAPAWEALRERALREVEAYHQANPLRRGMPREELKSRLKMSARVLQRRAEEAGCRKARWWKTGALVTRAGACGALHPAAAGAGGAAAGAFRRRALFTALR